MIFSGKGRINKAQSSLEYAMVIACAVGALLAMQFYVKRGMQGRLRAEADNLGQQYAPYHTTGTQNITHTSTSTASTMTVSEQELRQRCEDEGNKNPNFDLERCQKNADIDGDGVWKEDVFATESVSQLGDKDGLNPDTTIQQGSETVEPMGTDLLAD